jgi:hypothetical protein
MIMTIMKDFGCESLRDATERARDRFVLLREHRAQIEQHSAFLNPRNHRWSGPAQACGQFVSAQAGATQRNKTRGQHRGWRRAAANYGLAVDDLSS